MKYVHKKIYLLEDLNMKIGIIGATGKAGSLIVKEASDRGHEVTAIVRNAAKLTEENAVALEKDIFDLQADDLQQFDVVVNAFGAPAGQENLHVDAGKVLIEAAKGAPDTRIIVVGGAGSLFVDEAKSIRVIDTPDFPKEYFATASNQGQNLEDLQKTSGIKWTFISPAAFFNPEGKRTGSYKKGKDNLIVNSKGNSYVSYADYAIAVLDEIEKPQHINERFTLVSEAE
jgi:putative NADH-flavin reductase